MFTNTQPSSKSSVLQRQKDATRTPVSCPESILLYNMYMGGVDRGDQLRGYYSCRTKSRKFYSYVFLYDMAITNAYILQKNFCPVNVHKNIKQFRLQLVHELMGDYCSRRRAGRRPSLIALAWRSWYRWIALETCITLVIRFLQQSCVTRNYNEFFATRL